MKTHLEVQQREYIRLDRAERMKFVPPDLQVEKVCSTGKKIPEKSARMHIW